MRITSEIRRIVVRRPGLLFRLGLMLWAWPVWAGSPDPVADRLAIEQVYYSHRLGTKPPFGEIMTQAVAAKLVQEDRSKELILKKTYGTEITPAMVAAEVRRINTTTRAPETLAELRAALANDTNRFANAVARPIVVERSLQEKFESDAAVNAFQRHQAEAVRAELLALQGQGTRPEQLIARLKQLGSNRVYETTWEFGRRPAAVDDHDAKRTFYFEDLPPELQRVLNAQMRQAGNISAIIEMPQAFLVYLCVGRSAEIMTTATLSIPKRSYQQWLAEQMEKNS